MAAAKQKRIKKGISRYITTLRYVTTSVTGRHLMEMGLEQGAVYKKVLDAVLYAKLDGRLKKTQDELKFVKKYVSRL
jgi:tRNA nucleotidyltransferase (CCA-adding enzyme)